MSVSFHVCAVCEFWVYGKTHNLWCCVVIGSAVLFILRSRFLVHSAGSGVNRVQVVLSGFSVRLFCFVQAKTLCRYGFMYFFAALVLLCLEVMVMPSA